MTFFEKLNYQKFIFVLWVQIYLFEINNNNKR
jgi:hypothetical protein